MVVGLLRLDMRLHGCQNLKQKRGVVQKVLSRCRNRFPVSAAEIGHQDLWQRAEFGFAVLNTSEQVIAPILERLEEEVASSGDVEIIDVDTEYIHC